MPFFSTTLLSTSALSILLLASSVCSQSLPSAWSSGIATNYGGAQDGMDPSSPSYGTLDVSLRPELVFISLVGNVQLLQNGKAAAW